MNPVGVVIGTRPEAIKLAPLITQLRADGMPVDVVVTGQHRELLTPILDFFDHQPDLTLDTLVPGQSLGQLTSRLLSGLDDWAAVQTLSAIVVQGDTTSALAGAMIGFYRQIPVVHVEAGLRTASINSPFPEEFNRRTIDQFATLKFPPTATAMANLVADRQHNQAWVVGNTVIDALQLGLRLIDARGEAPYERWASQVGVRMDHRRILVTTHRRENAGEGIQNICGAILDIVAAFPDVQIMLPVHRNPAFYDRVHGELGRHPQIVLVDPLPYDQLIWSMRNATLILTDSGGLQEEAPALDKPVLVMRDSTERPEGVQAGCARLVGTNRDAIVAAVSELLTRPDRYQAMANSPNPYGDGTASAQISHRLRSYLQF